MRLLYLPLFWTLVLDSVAWSILQPGIGYLSMRFPPSWLDPKRWLYRSHAWEREGGIYQSLFRVRRWKSRLPSAGTLFGGFSMTQVSVRDPNYLERWLSETCRAELCHWLAMAPALLFFLWNPPWLALVMVAYAIVFNAIPIMAQRYNRPRLLALLARMGSRDAAVVAIEAGRP